MSPSLIHLNSFTLNWGIFTELEDVVEGEGNAEDEGEVRRADFLGVGSRGGPALFVEGGGLLNIAALAVARASWCLNILTMS